MNDTNNAKTDTPDELAQARQRIAELEATLDGLRQSEQVLKASERQYRTIVEAASGIVYSLDTSGRLTYVSPTIERTGGFTPDELIGRDFREFVHPEDLPGIVQNMTGTLAGRQAACKFRALNKDGTIRHVITSSTVLTENGRPVGILGIMIDVTEHRQIESALQTSQQTFQELVELLPQCVYEVNENGTFTFMNSYGLAATGYTADDLARGLHALDLIAPSDRVRCAQSIDRVLKGGKSPGNEYTVPRKDGTTLPVIIYASPIICDGKTVGLRGVVVDITEHKKAQEAARQNERDYRLLFESTLDGLFVLDGETFNVVLANETMARIAGLGSVAEGIGLNPLQFVHPHDQERAARIIVQDLFEKDLHETHEYRAITCDGREIWIEAVGRRIQYQGKRAGLISVRDITDRKRAERLINIQHDLAQALSAARDLHEGLHLCLEAARMASGMDCGGIYLREETSGAMELAFHQGLSQDFVKRASRFEAGSANCRLVMEGRPVYTQHPDLVASLDADSQGEGLKAIAVIPMTYEDLVIGCLNVASRVMDEVPVAVRKALELIAAQVSPAIISLGAREALRKSELRFRTIFENANDEIVLLDQWGTVIDRNKKGADLLGYTFEEVIGKKFTDLGSMLEPRSDHTVRKLFAAANEQPTREPWIIEVRAFHKDGSPVFLEASTSILEKGGKMDGLLVTLRDITERKQAEEQILQRNRHLATLNEIAQTINQSIDLDEILGNTLDKTLEILNTGYGSVHLMDQDQQTLTLRIHRGMIPDRLANYRTIQIGKGFLAQIPHLEEPTFIESLANLSTLTPPDAALIDEFQLKSAMLIPLKAKGELLGIMCMLTADQRIFTLEERELLTTVGHQISTAIENAQLIEEVSQAKALEELDRLRTALLASVSHELRTPLTSIKGLSSSLIQPDVQWDAETRNEFLKIIDRESDILTHIVNDLMEMSQIEAGIMHLKKELCTISLIFRQVSDHLHDIVKKHRFEVNVPDDLPAIFGDEIRLGEVITNLIANAASYSEPGTRITLEACQSEGKVIVAVTDEGIGIGADHIDKVFDRFYRLESGVARRRGGTGLGLSICKAIVEQHDGEIWVESKLGKGSKFSFSIPVSQGSEMEALQGDQTERLTRA